MSSGSSIKVVVLDFDGVITFLDVDWGYVRSLVSDVVGFEVGSLLDFWRDFFGSELFLKVSELVEGFEVEAADAAELVPEVAEFIREAAGMGIKVYVTTMQSEASVIRFLRKHGLLNYIADVLSREDLPTKRDMLEHILKIENVSPEEVVFIDDSERHIRSCKELGMKCLNARGKVSEVIEILRNMIKSRNR